MGEVETVLADAKRVAENLFDAVQNGTDQTTPLNDLKDAKDRMQRLVDEDG